MLMKKSDIKSILEKLRDMKDRQDNQTCEIEKLNILNKIILRY
jgi:hypothetical protein